MPLTRDWIPSPQFNAGRPSCRLIVVHTAEGATSYQGLGSYFQSPNAAQRQVSSHTGIDDTPNTIGEYVKRTDTSWTVANFNPIAVNAELCGWASWQLTDWMQHPVMLANTAAWIAEEAAAFKIPIRKLTPVLAQGGASGVCGHLDLGAAGGGHHDPGPLFPWDRVIAMAQTNQPPPEVAQLSSLIQFIDSKGVTTYAGYGADGHLYEYKADGARTGTPANAAQKTWSAYDLTASSAGPAAGKPFAV